MHHPSTLAITLTSLLLDANTATSVAKHLCPGKHRGSSSFAISVDADGIAVGLQASKMVQIELFVGL